MHHDDRLRLLERGVSFGGVWADLGCGDGAFTLPLAQLVGHEEGEIHAVDRDARALNTVSQLLQSRWPRLRLETHFADLMRLDRLPPLDGALIAFTLHDLSSHAAALQRVRTWLRPGGRLVVVEHDDAAPGPLAPNPCPWKRFEALARGAGFANPRLLGWVHSRFFSRAYGAACDVPR
jgi:ubiquinone/menaquinone biosynthesis C-methylase UbiE